MFYCTVHTSFLKKMEKMASFAMVVAPGDTGLTLGYIRLDIIPRSVFCL